MECPNCQQAVSILYEHAEETLAHRFLRWRCNRAKLIEAFKLGDIYAIGGMVFDAKHNLMFLTSDLAELRNDSEVKFARIDSGGRPTWRRFD